MQSLFPTNLSTSTKPPLVQFRAGKCDLVQQPNGKYRVSADLRRGNVLLTRDNDGLMHFKWTNKTNGAAEDDRIVMPGECTFKKVNTGREIDRVYLLKFHAGGPKLMFWMQSKSAEKDEESVASLNNFINNPQAVQEAAGAVAGPGGAGGDWMQMLGVNRPPPRAAAPSSSGQSNLGNLDLSAIMNALNPNNAQASRPVPVAPPAASSGSAPPLTIDDLRRAMLGSSAAAAGGTGTQLGGAAAQGTPSLQDILQADEVTRSGVLDDPQVREELIAQLPEGQQTAEDLQQTLRSPQLRQSMSALSHAVATDPTHFQTIASNLHLNASSRNVTNQLSSGDSLGALLFAVENTHPPISGAGTHTVAKEGEEKKQDDANDRMEE